MQFPDYGAMAFLFGVAACVASLLLGLLAGFRAGANETMRQYDLFLRGVNPENPFEP